MVQNLPAMQETWVLSLVWEDPLEKGMAIHFTILAWRIPWTVYQWGHRVGLDWVTFTWEAPEETGALWGWQDWTSSQRESQLSQGASAFLSGQCGLRKHLHTGGGSAGRVLLEGGRMGRGPHKPCLLLLRSVLCIRECPLCRHHLFSPWMNHRQFKIT